MEHNSSETNIELLKSKSNTFKDYIESLDPLHYKALTISIRELESSFSLDTLTILIQSIKPRNHKNN